MRRVEAGTIADAPADRNTPSGCHRRRDRIHRLRHWHFPFSANAIGDPALDHARDPHGDLCDRGRESESRSSVTEDWSASAMPPISGWADMSSASSTITSYRAIRVSGFIPGTNQFLITLLAAMAVSGLCAFILGALSLRTTGFQFIMITLAFAQMLFFLFVSLKAYGGDDGLIVRRRNVAVRSAYGRRYRLLFRVHDDRHRIFPTLCEACQIGFRTCPGRHAAE